MALKKYVGPFDAVTVRVAGNELGTVENGASIVVPDELAGLTEWPADHWENVMSEGDDD